MNKFIAVLLSICLLGTQGTAQSGESAGSEIIDGSFEIDKINWGGNGHIALAIKIKEVDGNYALCAAAAFNNSIGRNGNKNALRALKFMVDNRVALRGVHWANIHPKGANLMGRDANCRVSKIAIKPNAKLGFQMAKTSF